MKLVVIYGPTAAGKHTVGQKLSELTGYHFFYNHLTVDVVRVLFDDEDKRRRKLLHKLRIDTIEEAARYNMNVVFTMAYTEQPHSREFVRAIREAVAKHDGTIHFVRLDPPDATLFERIGNESRRLLRKPTDPEHLRRVLATKQMRVDIDSEVLVLDTSKLSPEQSANRIIDHFGLL